MFLNRVTNFILLEYISNINNHNNIRHLAKWTTRRPLKVIPSDEYDEEEDVHIKRTAPVDSGKEYNQNTYKNEKVNVPFYVKPLTISKQKQTPKVTMDMLETTIDEKGNFIYTKMQNNDSRITTVLTEIKSKNDRDKKDLILLEGKRLIKDALDAHCKLEYVLFSRLKEVEYLRQSIPKIGAKLYKMPYREIQMWSNLTTSPGGHKC